MLGLEVAFITFNSRGSSLLEMQLLALKFAILQEKIDLPDNFIECQLTSFKSVDASSL